MKKYTQYQVKKEEADKSSLRNQTIVLLPFETSPREPYLSSDLGEKLCLGDNIPGIFFSLQNLLEGDDIDISAILIMASVV